MLCKKKFTWPCLQTAAFKMALSKKKNKKQVEAPRGPVGIHASFTKDVSLTLVFPSVMTNCWRRLFIGMEWNILVTAVW